MENRLQDQKTGYFRKESHMMVFFESNRIPLIFALAFVCAPTATPAQAKPKVLFLGGGATSHDPAAFRNALVPVFERAGMAVEYRTNESVLQADSLGRYDVMLIYNAKKGSKTDGSPDLTKAQEDALYQWIRDGHALIGVHSANSSYLGNPRYLDLFGGSYTVHGDIQAYKFITIAAPGHPAMKGLQPPPAAGNREYWDEGREAKFTKTDTVMLARAKANGKDQPWTWVRPEGKGWVYYTSSGHDIRAWSDANFQKQIAQALAWGVSLNPTVALYGGMRTPGSASASGRGGFSVGWSSSRYFDVTGATVAAEQSSAQARMTPGAYLIQPVSGRGLSGRAEIRMGGSDVE